MSKTTIAELDRIQAERRRDMIMRELRDDTISIVIGLGDHDTFEESRNVVKAICELVEGMPIENIVVRQRAYDNQDGWAPVLWIEKPDQEGLQVFAKVTPAKAVQIVQDALQDEISKGGIA